MLTNILEHLKKKSSNGKIVSLNSFFNHSYVLSTHSCDVTHSESFTASQTAYLKWIAFDTIYFFSQKEAVNLQREDNSQV